MSRWLSLEFVENFKKKLKEKRRKIEGKPECWNDNVVKNENLGLENLSSACDNFHGFGKFLRSVRVIFMV